MQGITRDTEKNCANKRQEGQLDKKREERLQTAEIKRKKHKRESKEKELKIKIRRKMKEFSTREREKRKMLERKDQV